MTGLVKQLQEKTGFSESEAMIADYLLTHFRMLPGMSTRQLAKETFTSSAAIVRFSGILYIHCSIRLRVLSLMPSRIRGRCLTRRILCGH